MPELMVNPLRDLSILGRECEVTSGLRGHSEQGVDEVSFTQTTKKGLSIGKIGSITKSIQESDSGYPKPKNVQYTVLIDTHQESHCS